MCLAGGRVRTWLTVVGAVKSHLVYMAIVDLYPHSSEAYQRRSTSFPLRCLEEEEATGGGKVGGGTLARVVDFWIGVRLYVCGTLRVWDARDTRPTGSREDSITSPAGVTLDPEP